MVKGSSGKTEAPAVTRWGFSLMGQRTCHRRLLDQLRLVPTRGFNAVSESRFAGWLKAYQHLAAPRKTKPQGEPGADAVTESLSSHFRPAAPATP